MAVGKWHLGITWAGVDGKPVTVSAADAANWDKVRVGTNAQGAYLKSILDGPLAHGFDQFFGLVGNFRVSRQFNVTAYIRDDAFVGVPTWNGAPPQSGEASFGPGVPDWDQQRIGEQYINKVLNYIDRHVASGSTKPFFLYYVPNANHEPHDPAKTIAVQGHTFPVRGQARFSDGSVGGAREDMVYENDLELGLILDKLEAVNDPRTGRPMVDSTLLIFTSDNGADARGVGSAGLRELKASLYEGGHREPFIASWPDGGVPAGAVSSANFGHVDLYASLAGLLGHAMGPDEAEDSENVLSALLGQVTGSSFRRPQSLVSHDDSLPRNDLPDDAALAIRENRYLMMIDGQLVNSDRLSGNDRGRAVPIKLFDLNADLHQDVDLLASPERQSLISVLSSRLLRYHNQGYSRDLQLGAGPILHSDGGVNLRNNRSGSIGYAFAIGDQPIVIRSLGLWDDAATDRPNQESATKSDGQTGGSPDGLRVAHVVRLFDGASRQVLATATVNNGNSYLVGEFRYADLAKPVVLAPGKRYALTANTSPSDGDLFHHFAAYSAVGPSPSNLVREFVARVATADGKYPDQYPDGVDGVDNRHPDMFRHRMFVGPNARIDALPLSCGSPTYDPATDAKLYLWEEDCGGATRRYRVMALAGGSAKAITYAGRVNADQAFTSVNPVSLEQGDLLDVLSAGRQVQYRMQVIGSRNDGFDFSVADGTRVCVGLDLPAGAAVFVGPTAVPVATPFSLPDFGACTP